MRELALLLSASFIACGYGGKACKVVDLAHNACTVVRYLGPDGKTHEVTLTPAELAALEAQKK